jgi:hypothetical protein
MRADPFMDSLTARTKHTRHRHKGASESECAQLHNSNVHSAHALDAMIRAQASLSPDSFAGTKSPNT